MVDDDDVAARSRRPDVAILPKNTCWPWYDGKFSVGELAQVLDYSGLGKDKK